MRCIFVAISLFIASSEIAYATEQAETCTDVFLPAANASKSGCIWHLHCRWRSCCCRNGGDDVAKSSKACCHSCGWRFEAELTCNQSQRTDVARSDESGYSTLVVFLIIVSILLALTTAALIVSNLYWCHRWKRQQPPLQADLSGIFVDECGADQNVAVVGRPVSPQISPACNGGDVTPGYVGPEAERFRFDRKSVDVAGRSLSAGRRLKLRCDASADGRRSSRSASNPLNLKAQPHSMNEIDSMLQAAEYEAAGLTSTAASTEQRAGENAAGLLLNDQGTGRVVETNEASATASESRQGRKLRQSDRSGLDEGSNQRETHRLWGDLRLDVEHNAELVQNPSASQQFEKPSRKRSDGNMLDAPVGEDALARPSMRAASRRAGVERNASEHRVAQDPAGDMEPSHRLTAGAASRQGVKVRAQSDHMLLEAARDMKRTSKEVPRSFDVALDVAPESEIDNPLAAALEARQKVQGLLQKVSSLTPSISSSSNSNAPFGRSSASTSTAPQLLPSRFGVLEAPSPTQPGSDSNGQISEKAGSGEDVLGMEARLHEINDFAKRASFSSASDLRAARTHERVSIANSRRGRGRGRGKRPSADNISQRGNHSRLDSSGDDAEPPRRLQGMPSDNAGHEGHQLEPIRRSRVISDASWNSDGLRAMTSGSSWRSSDRTSRQDNVKDHDVHLF